MIRTKMKTRLTLIEGKRRAQQLVKQIDTKEMSKSLEASAGWGGTIQGASTADINNSTMLKAMRMGMPPDDAIRFAQRTIAALAAMDGCNERE